jgi:hypothetical protein
MSRGPGKPPRNGDDDPDEYDDVPKDEGLGDERDPTGDEDLGEEDDLDDEDLDDEDLDDEDLDDDDLDEDDEDDEPETVDDLVAAFHPDETDDDDDDDGGDDGDEDESSDDLPASTVFVATATPLQLNVAPMPDDRAPDGVCLASRIDGRLVARCAMPGESIERLMTLKLFEEPVMIGLLAFEAEPGIQARLVALVPSARLTEGSSEEDEPWKASVPSFEKAQRDAAEGEEGDAEGAGLAAILLGHIVRFTVDRKHPDDLAREAVDILQRVVAGAPLSDAAAKAIDDLLDSL